jgi:hypothetical protein
MPFKLISVWKKIFNWELNRKALNIYRVKGLMAVMGYWWAECLFLRSGRGFIFVGFLLDSLDIFTCDFLGILGDS